MSNHFHLVVRIDRERAQAWSDDEVVERFGRLFPGAVAGLEQLPRGLRRHKVTLWRARLWDLSWFMRCLNESIARQANKEDDCKGRFWEGRFRSQALLDEGALLTCMTYVDLNPVRAGIAKSLEGSDFTSIQERLRQAAQREAKASKDADASKPETKVPKRKARRRRTKLAELLPFQSPVAPKVRSARDTDDREAVPMLFKDYEQLVRYTGQAIRTDQRGALPEKLAPLVERAGLNAETFVGSVQQYARTFFGMVGQVERIRIEGARRGQQHVKGVRAARDLYARNAA